MSLWLIIVLIVVAVAIAALAIARPFPGLPGLPGAAPGGLRRRFGPEYDREVERHDGDRKAAEKELSERVRRYGKLRETPLQPAARERYDTEWSRIQQHFVDSPARAAAEADRLVGRLATDRGYPDTDYDERIAALSVHHPRHLGHYRRLHELAQREPERAGAEPPTEETREVLVGARKLFTDLAGKPGTAPSAAEPRGGNKLTERLHPPRALRRSGGAGRSAT